MYRIKYSQSFVQERIAATVRELTESGVINPNTVFLVMLNGGVWFASHLFDEIPDMLNEVYFIKGHSYQGATRGEFIWDLSPEPGLQNRQVVVLDDICDSGHTTNAIYDALRPLTSQVSFLTLLRRTTCAIKPEVTLYSCIIDDSDDFFVGCGLDDYGAARMLPFVGVIPKDE